MYIKHISHEINSYEFIDILQSQFTDKLNWTIFFFNHFF